MGQAHAQQRTHQSSLQVGDCRDPPEWAFARSSNHLHYGRVHVPGGPRSGAAALREPRRPRHRATRHLVGPPARAVPGGRAPGGGAPRRNGRTRRRSVPGTPRLRRSPRLVLALRRPLHVGEAALHGRRVFRRRRVTLGGVRYDEIRPGCWQPGHASTTWTSTGPKHRCASPTSRASAARPLPKPPTRSSRCSACADNDWMVEEWCAGSGGRLLPLCLVPLWDADLATAEVERNAARGVRAIVFSEIPAYLGLPSVHSGYWDKFFAACASTGTVLCLHIGSGTKMPRTSDDAPDAVSVSMGFGNCVGSLADFIFSGVLERNPSLKLVYSEGQIGWIPFFLERADDIWETHRGWSLSRRCSSRTPVDLLLPPGLRLLLQGLPRCRVDRPRRCRQRDLRDRLPARGQHVAAHEEARSRHVRRSRCWDRSQGGARECHPSPRSRPHVTP